MLEVIVIDSSASQLCPKHWCHTWTLLSQCPWPTKWIQMVLESFWILYIVKFSIGSMSKCIHWTAWRLDILLSNMLYHSNYATGIIMRGLSEVRKGSMMFVFTNLCIIKECVKRLHLHQHYKINTDKIILQYHFQLHKVLFSTRKILLNFSMSLVFIRFRGSDLLVDSSFNSFIFVGLSIDNQDLEVGIWVPSVHNIDYKVQTTYIGSILATLCKPS